MPFVNPVIGSSGRDHGDPFVLEHLGTYHLFHTGADGIHGWTSADLIDWRHVGLVLAPDTGVAPWAQVDFWAPEVIVHGDEFLMYVAATRRGPDGRGDDSARRLGVARSRDPLGPYRLDPDPLVDHWAIDAHPYRDPSGAWWLFYNVRDERTRFRGVTGCGNVVVAFEPPRALSGAEREAAFPSAPWEGNRQQDWYWNEGAWLLERRGAYVQMYSGGFYGDATYAIGQALAETPAGPWRKDPDNPLFVSGARIAGAGHHSVALAPDGLTPYACYHAHLDGERPRTVHLDRLYWAGDRAQIGEGPGPQTRPSEDEQPHPPGPTRQLPGAWWQVSAWARGRVALGAIPIDAGDGGGYRRVVARRQDATLEVRVDGTIVYSGPAVDGHTIAGDDVRAQRIALVVEDATVSSLPPGGARSWPTPGRGPIDVVMAVRGSVAIEAGAARARVAGDPDGRYRLVRLQCEDASEVSVRADGRGAAVTDYIVTSAD